MRLPEVIQTSGKSRSRIYDAIKAGNFPTQVSIGARSVGWRASEIAAWVRSRPTPKIVPAAKFTTGTPTTTNDGAEVA